ISKNKQSHINNFSQSYENISFNIQSLLLKFKEDRPKAEKLNALMTTLKTHNSNMLVKDKDFYKTVTEREKQDIKLTSSKITSGVGTPVAFQFGSTAASVTTSTGTTGKPNTTTDQKLDTDKSGKSFSSTG